jgi:hypothetical protein
MLMSRPARIATLLTLAPLMAALTTATPVHAAPKPLTIAATALPPVLRGDNAENFAAVLREQGYKAQVKSTTDGTRYIDSAANGVFFTLTFADCNLKAGCSTLRYVASWERPEKFTPLQANEWNAGFKLARAAVDAEDYVILDYYLSLKGGVTNENFLDSFDWWTLLLTDFRKFMDGKQAEADKAAVEPGTKAKAKDNDGPSAADEDRAG